MPTVEGQRLIAEDDAFSVRLSASYTYGQDNQRLVAEESGTRTYYVAEGLSVLAEYVESGGAINPSWSKSYVYLGNRLLATLTPNGSGGEAVEHHHPDRLGTRLVTNPSTGTSFEQVTLPFGTALNAESTGATKTKLEHQTGNQTGVRPCDLRFCLRVASFVGRSHQVWSTSLYSIFMGRVIRLDEPTPSGLGRRLRRIKRQTTTTTCSPTWCESIRALRIAISSTTRCRG